MNVKKLIDNIFEYGKQCGAEDLEIKFNSGNSFKIGIFKQEIDSYSLNETVRLKLKVLYNGKIGTSYTENLDEECVKELVNHAIENSKLITSNDIVEIFEGSDSYTKVNTYNAELGKVSDVDKINFAKKAEEIAYDLDKRVIQVKASIYADEMIESTLCNTKGLNLNEKSNYAMSYVSVVCKENEQIKSDYSFVCSRDFKKFDPEKMAKEAVENAISMLGAKSISSGNYPCIIQNRTMASMLSAFTSSFSAENVQKDLSLLKGKLNEKIASEMLTIVDDPFLENGLSSSSYDAEGAACTYKKLVNNGILNSFMYNLKTAKKENKTTTGNSLGGSSIGPSNMYIVNGSASYNDLVKSIEKGIIIKSLDGLHAGLNPISGDFSLSSSGYYVENGNIVHPIEQITVAGNFFEMIKDISEIGNDLDFDIPGKSYIGSPSIKFNKISVAGL